MVEVPDERSARAVAEAYADTECVGQFGAVTDVGKRNGEWEVVFETHTTSEAYTHRVRISERAGTVIGHERSSRFD
jgi:hypothetical protein